MSGRGAVRIAGVAPVPTAVVATVTNWEELPSLWSALLAEVWGAVRAAGTRAGRNVMLYGDRRPSVEVGVELHGPFAGHGRVTRSALPGGRVAVTVEPGPPTPASLAAAHDRVLSWCHEHAREPTAVRWEVHGHWTGDSAEMYTEIHHALT